MIEELWIDDLQLMSPAGPLANYHVNAFKGIQMPAPRSNRPVRGRRHGSFELTTFYEPREFVFDLWVMGTSWANFWPADTAFKNVVKLQGSQLQRTIQFRRAGDPYGGMEWSYVIAEGEISPRFPHAGTPICVYEDVTLVAADPRLYFEAGGSVSGSSFSVYNAGNFNTPPIITVVGAGSPIITNNTLTTENKIYIKGAGGGTVVINTRDRTVTLNGSPAPNIFDADKSFFWGLNPGINNISSSGGTVTVAWNDARI